MARKKNLKGDFCYLHMRITQNLHRALSAKMKEQDKLCSQYVRQLIIKDLAVSEAHADWMRNPIASKFKPKED